LHPVELGRWLAGSGVGRRDAGTEVSLLIDLATGRFDVLLSGGLTPGSPPAAHPAGRHCDRAEDPR